MSYSIGPISFPFLEAHSWDARRQTQIVNVPFARQTGFSIGAELVSYSLSGQFYAGTEAEAKVLRRQLVELFNNSDIDFEYIQFDCDDEELSGWFLLDQVSVSIPPGTLGPYPFSASVRRLGNLSTHLFGTYWTSNPYTNDFALIGREWVAAPNSLGSPVNDDRPGEGGENQIVVAPAPLENPIVYRDQPTFADYYDLACRCYTTAGNPSDGLNGIADMPEVFSSGHVYSDANNDSLVVSNGLVAIAYNSSLGIATMQMIIYEPTLGIPWRTIVSSIDLFDTSLGVYRVVSQYPIVEKLSKDEIVLQVVYSVTADYDQNSVTVRYKIRRGTYFIDVHLKTKGADIDSTSRLLTTASVASPVTATNTYVATVNSVPAMSSAGFLHTETFVGVASGTNIQLGYDVLPNSETRFAVFVLPETIPTGTTVVNMGNEFIANMRQQPVLVDPRWL